MSPVKRLLRPQDGFTLLEVLVALAVFAVAAVSLLRVNESQLTLSGQIEDKTFAHWIALNQITEMQVRQDWPDTGEEKSKVSMAGRDWQITVKTQATEVSSMKRLDVSVGPMPQQMGEEAHIVTQLTAFLEQPHHGTEP